MIAGAVRDAGFAVFRTASRTASRALLLVVFLGAGSALAQPVCVGEANRKVAEAAALRVQARQEAIGGDRSRACDALGEAGDRYGDARDALEDCGFTVEAVDLRTPLRDVRRLERFYRCDAP